MVRPAASVAHGIMFHHFHRTGEKCAQGSITADDFADMIEAIGRKNILPAEEWYNRAIQGKLTPEDICLTFDDTLLSQYDIARPVMKAYNLTGFFFVYSSVCMGNIENLEIYRLFRTEYFDTLAEFYNEFEKAVDAHLPAVNLAKCMRDFRPEEYLKNFSFYSPEDRRFRYIRDEVLGNENYARVLDAMIAAHGLSKKALAQHLWMNNDCLRTLSGEGHMIGLHSFSHPTRLCEFPLATQREEYQKNYAHLQHTIGTPPVAMSHPCNSYGPETLDILRALPIHVGFCAHMGEVKNRSLLEFPRQDHADIMRKIRA